MYAVAWHLPLHTAHVARCSACRYARRRSMACSADDMLVDRRAPPPAYRAHTDRVHTVWGEGSFSIRFWGHFLSNTVSRCITTVSRCITIHPPLRCMYHIVSRMYHYRIILDDGRGFMILCITNVSRCITSVSGSTPTARITLDVIHI